MIESFESVIEKLKDTLENYAPLKKITIPHKSIIGNPWLSKGLMKLSHTCTKLYSKCINKSKTDITYKIYIKYRNKENIRKTWKIINATICKLNDNTSTPKTFKIDNKNIFDPKIITDK